MVETNGYYYYDTHAFTYNRLLVKLHENKALFPFTFGGGGVEVLDIQ